MKIIRSYKKLFNEIINLNFSYQIGVIDYIQYDKRIYPFLCFRHISKMSKGNVVIVSGHHGNEFYSVHVLLNFLKQPIMFPEFNYFIYPCLNCFGYETGSRNAENRKDTNNVKNFYKNSDVQELALLHETMPTDLNLYLDIHGDSGKNEIVYGYERHSENLPSIAEPSLVENDNLLAYAKTHTIYGDKIKNGILSCYSDFDMGLEGIIESIGANYTITIELPGICNGQKRMVGGIAIINSILKNLALISAKEKK
jgi:hypothetical protein